MFFQSKSKPLKLISLCMFKIGSTPIGVPTKKAALICWFLFSRVRSVKTPPKLCPINTVFLLILDSYFLRTLNHWEILAGTTGGEGKCGTVTLVPFFSSSCFNHGNQFSCG